MKRLQMPLLAAAIVVLAGAVQAGGQEPTVDRLQPDERQQSYANGQDAGEQRQKSWSIRFTGFVKSDYWRDSRRVVAAREDLFLVLPANRDPDVNGDDINATPYFNYSAITSRVAVIIDGPEAFGAATSAMVEADFSGMSNADINGFRLRHAVGRLRWQSSELAFGQFWHPMFVTEVCPEVISLNTGAPFQPFIRNPQVSYTHFFGQVGLSFTLLSQRDNASDGPIGADPIYIRSASVPNAHVQVQVKGARHVWGLGGDYKVLRPRLVTPAGFRTGETIGSYAAVAYWRYRQDKLTLRSKTIYGQNLTEHLMLGGYAVRTVDPTTMAETYTPTNHLFAWGSVNYGERVRGGLFAGFARNFGTSHENTGTYFSRGADVGHAYRLSPSISVISGPVQVSTEIERTVAAYGMPDRRGRVRDAQPIGNTRLLVTLFYFF
jgi:hypothetical protein